VSNNSIKLQQILGNTYSNVSSKSIRGETTAQSASAFARSTLLTRPAPPLTSATKSTRSPFPTSYISET